MIGMRYTGSKRDGNKSAKNDLDEHEINKNCRSSCQMYGGFFSSDFNQWHVFVVVHAAATNIETDESAILMVWFILIFNFVHIMKLWSNCISLGPTARPRKNVSVKSNISKIFGTDQLIDSLMNIGNRCDLNNGNNYNFM